MSWNRSKQARMDEISAELVTLVNKSSRSDADRRAMTALTDEGTALLAEKQTYEKASGYGSYASPSEFGITGNPGDDSGVWFKGIAPGMENRIRPSSMYELDKIPTQLRPRGPTGSGVVPILYSFGSFTDPTLGPCISLGSPVRETLMPSMSDTYHRPALPCRRH